MNIFWILICAVLAVEMENGVLVINEDNFREIVGKSKTGMLVEFYSPTCGHCKALEPIYAEAAEKLEKKGLFIAKIDASQN